MVFFAANHLTCGNLLKKLTSWPFPYVILSSSEAQWVVTKFLALCGKDKLRGTLRGPGVAGVIDHPTVKYWPHLH